MDDKLLKKKFYRRFFSESIIYIISIVVFTIITILAASDYIQAGKELWVVVISSILLIICFIIVVFELRLLILDFLLLKRGAYRKVTGTIIGIKEKEQGGDPPIITYYPIIRDDLTGKEIKLDVMGIDVKNSIHKYCRYSFLYLPHTKYAVLIETFSFIGKNEADIV